MIGIHPYKFTPLYKPTIWGGRALERLFGRPLRQDARVGESWELADLREGQSLVAEGNDAGKSIQDIIKERGQSLLGGVKLVNGQRFPLLLKLLDANDILSLQVHPDEATAVRLGSAAKTECWYILESRDGYILKDCRPGVTRQDFEQTLAKPNGEQLLAELVERVDVKAGDFFHLPAGTVHAMGSGLVVAEIQQPSDTTYRVSDWGRGRPIHVKEAMESIHFTPAQPVPGAAGEVLVASPYFTVAKRCLPAGEHKLAHGRCVAWMNLRGRGRLECEHYSGQASIGLGQTLLLPAGLEQPVLRVQEDMELLEITLPEG